MGWLKDVGDWIVDTGENLWDDWTGNSAIESQNKANKSEAQKNREWQEQQATTAWERQMSASNTAHQRQVADLKRAGLNPILAVGGKGAATPSASVGSGAQARMERKKSGSEKTQEAYMLANSAQAVRNARKTEQLIEDQSMAANQQGWVNYYTADKVKQEVKTAAEQTKVTANTAKNLDLQNTVLTAQAIDAVNQMKVSDTKAGSILKTIRMIRDSILK